LFQARAEAASFFKKKGEERTADKEQGRGERQVVDIPPDLIFFWRVIGLLRGLCASLKVRNLCI